MIHRWLHHDLNLPGILAYMSGPVVLQDSIRLQKPHVVRGRVRLLGIDCGGDVTDTVLALLGSCVHCNLALRTSIIRRLRVLYFSLNRGQVSEFPLNVYLARFWQPIRLEHREELHLVARNMILSLYLARILVFRHGILVMFVQ